MAMCGVALVLLPAAELPAQPLWNLRQNDDTFVIESTNYDLHIINDGFRYGLAHPDGSVIAPAHPVSGLVLDGQAARQTTLIRYHDAGIEFRVACGQAGFARVWVTPAPDHVRFHVRREDEPADESSIVLRTGGVTPGFGLADHAGYPIGAQSPDTTQITDYVNDHFVASYGRSHGRLISNFVIFPKQRLACANLVREPKIVRVTPEQLAQGAKGVRTMEGLVYFVGDPPTIYRDWLEVRNAAGYRVFKPKYELFGVGWEAWGALEWNTNQASVTDHVNRYLDLGFPLRWMVIGSGFWPQEEERFHATTSFGQWDATKYPEPRRMLDHFHGRGLKVLIGLRIAFTLKGPFTAEGVRRGFFMTDEDGQPAPMRAGFPRQSVYLLDTDNPEAVDWYVGLCEKWLSDGIDGFKEDLFGFGKLGLRDGTIDPVNVALMERGVHIMGRNGYIGSPMDLHRFEDFNFNHPQDRGPINGLCLAYAGFPNVYPDVIGGAPSAGGLRAALETEKAKLYLMREAWYAAINPSMAFGLGVWELDDPQVVEVTRRAALLHDALHPYIYDAAIDAARTGYPYPMTPLPVAFPEDPEVYDLANTRRRSYQWLIGESLLAAPLYGDDYATATTRDVYLPRGKWMEWDSGKVHQGPVTLKDYPLPVEKTPLFVGGSGIVITQERAVDRSAETGMFAHIYRIAPKGAELVFTWPDGRSASTIQRGEGEWDARELWIEDITEGTRVSVERDEHKITFAIALGHDYILKTSP